MLDTLLTAFITFFVILDPLGTVPIFASLTHGASEQMRREMAIKATITAACSLTVFAVVGDQLLKFLGISLPAFRIAGGALLFLLSIDMVLARQSGLRSTTASEEEEAEHKTDVAIFPLAIPLIAGPGAFTSVILLLGRNVGDPTRQLAVVAMLLAVLSLNLVSFLIASRIMNWMGRTGINVVTRIFGIILAALAVQFIIDGIAESFPHPGRQARPAAIAALAS